MRRRFFVDGFDGGEATLTGDAAHHLARVLRAEPGQLYELSDGETLWLAETESVGRDEIHFLLREQLPAHTPAVRIALLLAIVKFDRLEWAIEKSTELGVDEIIPLIADRSEHGLIAAAPKRSERWRKILAESAQQSRRLRIPHLAEAVKARAAFSACDAQVRVLLSERSGAAPLRALLEPAAGMNDSDHSGADSHEKRDSSAKGVPRFSVNAHRERNDGRASKSEIGGSVNGTSPTRVAVAIGPEGGWTDAEFSAAASSGFSEVALGANILRTETAVCAALAAVQYAFGAFRPNGDEVLSEYNPVKENT